MLIEAAERAEAAAKNMLACLHDGAASSADLRRALNVSKALISVVSLFQTDAAAAIAARERHGDGGTQVLADAAGLSRRDARGQVKAAKAIESAPAVRDAVEEGRVSLANAKRLAEAVAKTSAETVASDSELLAKAESMRPEQFTREARRWTADRQHDGGEADYRRLRAKRRVRVWDADDGLVHLHGQFDPVAGRRIANRLRAEAGRLHDADKKQAADRASTERRSFDQCMADALDNLTTSASDGGGKPFADICVVAHLDEATGKLVAETPEGQRLPDSVLEELACNAKFTGLLYDHDGKPIWRAHSVRGATKAQRQILFARYGGCFHCSAHPAMCQIHHIKPVSQGGSTKLDNMVPVCWNCHQRIHHQHWQIRTHRGRHTLHPPERTHHGPAHAPEQPVLHTSHTEYATNPPAPDFQPPPRRHPAPRQGGTKQASSTLAEHPNESGSDPADDRAALALPGPGAGTDAASSARAKGTQHPPLRPVLPRRPARRDEPLFRLGS